MSSAATDSTVTRIGLIGYGRWGALVARDLRALGADLTVCGNGASVQRAREAGIESVAAEAGELAGVDGVVICTPTPVHAESIDSVAGLGVPIFVEKPMTDDVAAARRLASQLGDRLFVMDKWRYHRGVEKLGEIARGGELGAVVGLRSRRLSRKLGHDNADAAWVLLPHDLSIGYEILGQRLEPAHAVGLADAGGVRHLEVTLGSAPWHRVDVSEYAAAHRRELELICTEGAAWLEDPLDDHLLVRRYDDLSGNPEQIPIATEMPLLRELDTFVRYVAGAGPAPRSSAAEGLWVVETVSRLRAMVAGAQEPASR